MNVLIYITLIVPRFKCSCGPRRSSQTRNNLWCMRNDIENFQYGLENKLHKTEGWLWKRLVEEGVVSDTNEMMREKCFQAYQAQQSFIMAQKQLMPAGWDPIDPIKSVKHH